MNRLLGRVIALAEQQHDVVAVWQLRQMGWSSADIHGALRHLRKVHRGVRAVGDLTEEGWYMAAALAGGAGAAISHLSALQLMGLRPTKPGDIHVTPAKRGWHHRARREHPAPPANPAGAVDTPGHPRQPAPPAVPLDRAQLPKDVVRLKTTIKGTTRSDARSRLHPLLPRPRPPAAAGQPVPQRLRDRLPPARASAGRRGRRLRAPPGAVAVQHRPPARPGPPRARLGGRPRVRRPRLRRAGAPAGRAHRR